MRWSKKWSTTVAIFTISTTAVASLKVSPQRAHPAENKSTQYVLDRQAERYLADQCRVGISMTARIGGRTWFANDGVVKRGSPVRPTPDSIYELAAVTKTFVGAIAAGALVDRRITLDGDFRIHLPGRYPNLVRSGLPITLRNLATHTSGLQRDLPDSDAILATPNYDTIASQFATLNEGYSRQGDLAELHRITLRSTPGTTFAYSNLGMRVLGYGLEDTFHLSLEELLNRNILRPLGMRSTAFTVAPIDRPRLATPHNRYGNVEPFHDASAGAGYGLYSTPRDMARYLAWQIDRPDAVVRRSHKLVRGDSQDGEALIWNVTTKDGERMLWHGGGSFGETSQVVLFPDDHEGYAFLANDACAGSETALKDLAISIRNALRATERPAV